MNESHNQFEVYLNEIDHYKKFPSMKPFIGSNYFKNERKIMLIAESHYLPPESVISKSSENWYKTTQSELSVEEMAWINTRNIVGSNWKSEGHMIFRELDLRMSDYFDTSKHRAMENVVFMNGFQRPSPATGDSIKNFCKDVDYQVGAKTIDEVIKILKPDVVIFVSKFSWDSLKWRLSNDNTNIRYEYVCHPGTGGIYWHNPNYKNGLKKFQSILNGKE